MKSSQSEPKNVLFGMRTGPSSLRPWAYLTPSSPPFPSDSVIHVIHAGKGVYLVAARAFGVKIFRLQIAAVSILSPQTRVRQDWT